MAPLAGVPLPTATVVGLGSVCAGCGNDRDTSLVFGVQVGYNYQFSPGSGFVVGVEADAQLLGEQGSSNRRGGVTGTTLVTPASVGTPPFALFGSAPLVQLGPNTFTFFPPGRAKRKPRLVRDGSPAARICLRSLAGVRDRRACLFGRRSG